MNEECFFFPSSFFEQAVGINGIIGKDLKLNIIRVFLFWSLLASSSSMQHMMMILAIILSQFMCLVLCQLVLCPNES